MHICRVILLWIVFLVPSVSSALTLVPQSITVNGHSVTLQVPQGMVVDFMAPMNAPRFAAIGPDGELIVGSKAVSGVGSTIYRLATPYSQAEALVVLPGYYHSVAYRQGTLFAAETGALWKAPYSGLSTSLGSGDFSQVVDLPSQTGGHSSRTVIVGPDGKLYVSLGISGNCSNEYLAGTLPTYDFEHRRGGVYLVDETGSTAVLQPFSSGLRNPIGIAFDPASGYFWTTNAGSDNLGFDQPPEIFSRLTRGSYHGMPWFQYMNGAFQDGECIDTNTAPRPAGEATAPAVTFEARSTPMGIAFVDTASLGSPFSGNALVSIHGSWATDPAQGGGPETRRPPKVVMVNFSGAQPTGVEDVITGFQRSDGSRFARPCGAVMGPDGNFYFTSDSGDVQGLFRLRKQHSPAVGGGDFSPSVLLPLLDNRQ